MNSYRCHVPAMFCLVGSFLFAVDAEISRASNVSAETLGRQSRTPEPNAGPSPEPRPVVVSLGQIERHIAAAAMKYDVSPELIRAVIEAESDFNPRAVSIRGACGLMQLMPATSDRFGVTDCFDARQNIHAGTRLLKALLTRYDGSVSLAIAAYNAGEGAVQRHGGIPPYGQTRAYIRKVEGLLEADLEFGPVGAPSGS